MSETNHEGTFIKFWLLSRTPGRVTREWQLVAKKGGALGVVKWFSLWRKYGFYPADDCVFEETCMREISEFIEMRTREHKEARR